MDIISRIINVTSTEAPRQVINAETLANLSLLEKAWLQMFQNSSNHALTLAVFMFSLHEIAYFGRFIPYWIMESIPYFDRYKIQDTKTTWAQFWKVAKFAIWSQVFVQLPMMFTFKNVITMLGVAVLDVPFPSYTTLFLQSVYFALCEDTYHYWVHRAAHFGALYKHIHKFHHEFTAPFGITAEYAHTLEVLFLGLGFFVGPVTWALATLSATDPKLKLHVISMAVWMVVRLVLTVDDHSGYDFPWSLHHWIPFWAGADFHDYHHMAFIGNYGSTFRHWDWICGTDAGYNAHSSKIRAAKKAKKALERLQQQQQQQSVNSDKKKSQ